MFLFGMRRGLDRDEMRAWLATQSLCADGHAAVHHGRRRRVQAGDRGFAAWGRMPGKLLVTSSISPLLVAYLIAAAMRIAQGSATVAIITAAGIVAPLVKGLHGLQSGDHRAGGVLRRHRSFRT